MNNIKRDNRAKFSLTFLLLTVLFCVCLIVSNLMEIKTVSLGFVTITAGFMVFPISYILNDCIVEIYGFARARLVIWLGFAMLGLLSAKFPITISRMKKFYGALNFLRNANRLLLSENAIILA